MSFRNAVENQNYNAKTTTANGMVAYKDTSNKNLDLFGKIGSSRGFDISPYFSAALAENEDLAVRILLWGRDVRGGAGERNTFRKLLGAMEQENPTLAGSIMHMIPVVGRWDDLFTYTTPMNIERAITFYADALKAGEGLAFKWAPREKSKRYPGVAKQLAIALGMTMRGYRKFLAANTDVVETKMCAKRWDAIEFEKLPSLASARYQKAFERNAAKSYAKYVEALQKGEAKINAGAVYPYDVVKSCIAGNKAVSNEQWKALPNYLEGAKIMPMVDVSYSMTCSVGGMTGFTCMDMAVALGLYVADKNTTAFKDMFLTFDSNPSIEILKGSLSQKISQLRNADWGGSTDLTKAFERILALAVSNGVSQEDMPEYLVVFSDMQFNSYGNKDVNQMIRTKYEKAGYAIPKVIFWNLNAAYGADNTPVKFDTNGTALVSGFSPALMKAVLSADLEQFTPLNVMLQAVMDSRYDWKL